jgi:hypothetical protein
MSSYLNMKIKDPTLRSCYSHTLLTDIEEEIDEYRDNNGDEITEEDFKNIVSKYQNKVPEESELLYILAFENFIEAEAFADRSEEFEGMDDRSFPEYKFILRGLEKVSDELWEAYDREVYVLTLELCNHILDHEKVINIGTEAVHHQMSFNEETCECLHAMMLVLKTLVPYKDNSKYQNSVKRAETWLHDAVLY